MNSDGTGFTKLTTDPKYDCAAPQWSPDGKKILYECSMAIQKPWKEITKEEMKQKNKSRSIMMMNADGSGKQVLISNMEGVAAPSWSHYGKTIYFITKQDTGATLNNMHVNKNRPESLLIIPGVVYSASISPDEKYVAYAAEREKKQAVYIQDIKTKSERKVIGD